MTNNTNDNIDDMNDIEMIDITYDDGTECNCEVIARFDVDGITYIALLPEDDEDSDIIVYRYAEDGRLCPRPSIRKAPRIWRKCCINPTIC